MAEPIVRSFVIDTSESEQNLKELNTTINATDAAINKGAQAFDNVAVAQDEVVASSKSLKAQLRDLQAQLANTEPDSAKYRELSQAAGELKDRIGDAAEAVGTQAGGAFERVSGSLGLVTSRIANLDFEGAAEGAKLLAQNITQIKPGDITKGIQGIGSAFASIGKALLTNPIFLIGAAIAAAIVYADELLSLIDGVTDAETQALDVQKERAALAKDQVDLISSQEQQLKLQGKTEKEITALKLQALDTAILEQQAVVETTRIQAEGQIKAAERNAEYLKTFLDFVTFPQRKLAEFFEGFVNGSIDILNKLGLGIEKINVSGVFEDVNNFIVKQVFDPAAERKNQEQIVKDAEKSLNQLNEQRAGIINSQNASEKAAREKAANDAKSQEEKAAAEIKAIRDKELADELARIDALNEARKKANEDRIAQEEAQFALLQDLTLTAQQKEIQAAVKLAEERLIIAGTDANLQKLVAEDRDKSITEINAKYAQAQVDTTKAANDAEVQSAQEAEAKKIQTRQQSFAKGLELAQNAIAVLQAFSDASTKNGERDAKKKFRTDKALAIGAATVQTASAVTGALTAGGNPVKLATGAQFVEAAVAGALGLAQIIKIKNSQFGGGATGGNDSSSSVPSTGGGGDTGSQPAQFNPLASSFLQDRPEQLTPRAYVLAGDVASQQEVRTKVEDLSRIG
jgi:hypothetical protein